ncbi:MAG: hypothetical protein JNL85_14615 [Rubrivivax sp.]|nr:hypothetical protein [Rubrivivax sp.]
MRRGLMAWSHDEVPPALLERRMAALVAGLRERALHCVLVYTDLTRPAAVSALTHFIPYWSNGVLVVAPDAGATLVATMSRRVADWIHSTSRLDRLVNTLDLGQGVSDALPAAAGAALRVGVVELAGLPDGVVAVVRRRRPDVRFEEAGDLLDAALAPGGGTPQAVVQRALAIAGSALAAGLEQAGRGDAAAVLAAAEGTARLAGAEEVALALAPDMRSDPRLRRIEGTAALGREVALQVTLAYKGCWLRLARTAAPDGAAPPRLARTEAWFQELLANSPADSPERLTAAIDAALPRLPGARVESWRLEGARAGLALATLAASQWPSRGVATATTPPTLSLRLRDEEGPWFGAGVIATRAGAQQAPRAGAPHAAATGVSSA